MNLEIRYSPPNQSQQIVPVRDRLMIGSLLSNEVVIRAPGVEPIHAMIELLENKVPMLTDLGSQSGVLLNGQKVDVEAPIKIGDRITVGNVVIEVHPYEAAAAGQFKSAMTDGTRSTGEMPVTRSKVSLTAPPATRLNLESAHDTSHDEDEDDEDDEEHAVDMNDEGNPTRTVRSAGAGAERSSDFDNQLFSPRNAKPSGNVLEVVAYWDDTVLDVELFHPRFKNYEKATIGSPPHAHFIAGGNSEIKSHTLARASEEGYSLQLLPDMKARLRKGGKVVEESGEKTISLSKHDIAHVTHGAVKYFLMFIKPPVLELPRNSARDPFFIGIMMVSILLYLAAIPTIYLSKNPDDDKNNDDIWSIVSAPEKKEEPKPIPKPKVEVAKVEKEPPPQPTPPKPPPKPPAPVPPEVKPKPVETPKQTKPTPPVEKPTQQLAEQKKEAVATPKPATPAPTKDAGQVNTGAKPDFKAPGQKTDGKVGPSGGAIGGGKVNPNAGGQRKGDQKTDLAGVEGGAPNKASGVNLSKLGLGAGKVLTQTGAGAIKTDFKDSAGGAGGGSGSAAKTYGLGGPGSGTTLGVAGAGGAVNNFGGFGGNGSGQGGTGGLGGAGLGQGFGKGAGTGRANVSVPEGDPVVSGGLTTQEVQAVIRANLNQIRHCYEQLLQRAPNANGKIKVNFTIGADGRVTASSINSDTIGDAVMAGCVTGKVQRWKFPNPRGGQSVNVNYPFVFNPL